MMPTPTEFTVGLAANNMKNLINALSFGGILSEDELKYVSGFFKVQKIKPGEEFLSGGSISNQIGFVDEGILRIYMIGGRTEEVTKYFVQQN